MGTINIGVPQLAATLDEAAKLGSLYINGGGQEYWVKATLLSDASPLSVARGAIYHRNSTKPIGSFVVQPQEQIEVSGLTREHCEKMQKWLGSCAGSMFYGRSPIQLTSISIENYITASCEAMQSMFIILSLCNKGFVVSFADESKPASIGTYSLTPDVGRTVSGYKTKFDQLLPDLMRQVDVIFCCEPHVDEILVWNALSLGMKHTYKRGDV